MKRIGFSEEQIIWILKEHQVGLGAYGRPRMTEEFQELGANVGHRRIGRSMRENGI